MKFTGERYVLSEKGRIFLEHFHRYAVLLDAVKGKDVLDIASGEGYGSAMLAKTAKSVTGVDISAEAIAHAKKKYRIENLRYLEGNAAELNLPDNSFDMVVSFETIEHLSQQDEVMAEFSRVLRPDGVLVLSSPNRPIYQKECGSNNEFHIKELDFAELDLLLKKKFEFVEYYGQRLQIGSVISPISPSLGLYSYQGYIEDNDYIKAGVASNAMPVYFLVICSNLRLVKDCISPSIFFLQTTDLLEEYMRYADWAKQVDSDIVDRKYEILMLKKEVDSLTKENIYLKSVLSAK